MKNIIATWVIWATLIANPLSTDESDFIKHEKTIEEWIKSNISTTLKSVDSNEIMSLWINARVVTNAALSYFDEEVRLYDLIWEPRKKVEATLMKYFSSHPILRVTQNWSLVFEIDDKAAFSDMIQELADAILWWMSPFMRTIAITIAFGWNAWLHNKLGDLDKTVRNLKSKEYKNIVFDYLGWIVKRVAKTVGWKMSVRGYYNSVNNYYPNIHSPQIISELNKSGQSHTDIRNLQYPFKSN